MSLGLQIKSIVAFLSKTHDPSRFSFELPLGGTLEQIDRAIEKAMGQRFGRSGAAGSTAAQMGLDLAQTFQQPVEDVSRLAADYAAGMTWQLIIPGRHYSGLSNQDLLHIFQANDRDIAADTPEIRDHLRKELISEFGGKPWDDDIAGQVAQKAIVDWVVRRVEEQGVDVTLRPLSAAYARQKAAEGYDSRIGIRKNKWLKSIRRARVQIDFKGE